MNRIDALLQALGRRVEEHIDSHDRSSIIQHPSPTVIGSIGSTQGDGQQQSAYSGGPPVSAGTPSSQGIASYAATAPFWSGSETTEVSHFGTSASTASGSTPQQQVNSTYNAPTSAPNVPGFRRPTLGPQSGLADLPPQDIVYSLVDLYFKHCNTWCPILDRKSAFGIFFGSTSMNEANKVLLHAIVALTLRFLKDPRLSPESKAHYHAVSKRTVQLYAIDNSNVEAVRAMVILCLDELGSSNGPKSWSILSRLIQNVRHLDLCEESRVFLATDEENLARTETLSRVLAGRPQSWIEDEGRRRIAWMVYLLDRYTTVASGTFDFMLDERRMHRVLPCSYDLFSRNVPVETQVLSPAGDQNSGETGDNYIITKPDNLGSFAYHCQILRILSRVHEFLRTPIDVTNATDMAEWRNKYNSLDASLTGWLSGLPSEYSKISSLCHSDPASRVANWFMLHSAYVVAVVRLHSAAAYPTVRSHYMVPSRYAMQRCLSAVQSLGDIARDVYEADGLDLLGPPFAMALWVASRLLIVDAATTGGPVDPKIDFLVETLRHVGQNWELAHKYADIITRVVQRGRQDDNNNGGNVKMGFASMRRSAFDLVMLTSSVRHSGLEPTSTQVTSLAELDNIDVFEFFNYPRGTPGRAAEAGSCQSTLMSNGPDGVVVNGMPDPESDWLRYRAPYQ